VDDIVLKVLIYMGIDELKHHVSPDAMLELTKLEDYIKKGTVTFTPAPERK
jgi:hypothetical protein